ncbi:MAG: phosphatidic acid phosphatase [Ruminococcaceae bacterium]|nr:phosphatidic acid phosphatase [Oscillospiraceae bacterium]
MQTPKVDYRQMSIKRLKEPQFSHLFLLLGWVVYFALFFLTENLIPTEKCFPVHCVLDDMIPFCEAFLIPYVGWYFLIVWSLVYFLLYNVENFKRLQVFIIVTQAVAMIAYIFIPTRQDLRPIVFPRDNFLTDCVALLYSLDTNTGVCPSLHCAYSIGIASVWLKEKGVTWRLKTFVVVCAVLICLSTMFIKQHSAVDFFAALPVCLLAEIIACGGYWKKRLLHK